MISVSSPLRITKIRSLVGKFPEILRNPQIAYLIDVSDTISYIILEEGD